MAKNDSYKIDDYDDDDDYYPKNKNSKRIRIENANAHNEMAKKMIYEGNYQTRFFKEKKKSKDRNECRKKINPDDYED